MEVRISFNRLSEYKKEVLLLILLSVLAPSLDVYSDTSLIVLLASSPDQRPYALGLLLPQLANTLFTLLLWSKMERESMRQWSWVLVILQCWPQVNYHFLGSHSLNYSLKFDF